MPDKDEQKFAAEQKVCPECGSAEAPNLGLRFEMSSGIGSLIAALAKARKSFLPIIKAETNPFFKSKYADLAAVIEATKDGLSDNGLAILQPTSYNREAGLVEVITLLAHSSGEWIRSALEMPMAKQDAQAVGSAITYGRRYSYSAVLNVASEQDDDGSAAVSKPFRGGKEESPEEFDQRTADQQNIGPAQIKTIDEALKATGKTEDEIKAALGFIGETRIEHIKKGKFDKFLKWAASSKDSIAKAKKIVGEAGGLGPNPEEQGRLRAMRSLFKLANDHSIPENDVKRASYERFGVDSMTKLTAAQLDDMHGWVKGVADSINQS